MENWILQEGNPRRLILKGVLKGKKVKDLREAQEFFESDPGFLQVDLSGLEGIDGSGFAALVALGLNPRVTLVRPPRCVRLPLEKTRLFESVEIEP